MSEENKALVRRAWEMANDLNVIDEVYSPDLVWHEPEGDVRGSEEAKQYVGMYLEAFPDTNFTIEDMIAEGDKVVTRWTARGTHRGELQGIAPTNKQVTITGITVHRIEGGKIVEEWDSGDNLGLMQQLGVIPEPGQGES
jgi:steroid delta-isomerase-like uncharacterized protein